MALHREKKNRHHLIFIAPTWPKTVDPTIVQLYQNEQGLIGRLT
jgi:hypothetical protein